MDMMFFHNVMTRGPNHLLLLYCIGPEKPVDITVTAQGTDNLNISWILPKGRVDHYVVNISIEGSMNSNITTVTTAHFSNLLPGRIFVITVTAVAGIFSETSAQTPIATGKFTLYCYWFRDFVFQILCSSI